MKTLLTVLVVCLGFSAMAQPPHHDKKSKYRSEKMKDLSAEQRAALMTKKMTLDLDLNETQQNQIYALILDKTKKHEKRRANKPEERPTKDDLYAMKMEQMDDQIAMKKAMKSILDESQYEVWTSIQKKADYLKKRKKHPKREER